jgi:hypothetical protein
MNSRTVIYRSASIAVFAVVVPILVAGKFPPPFGMSPTDALGFLAFLSLIGGLAGYGWSRL